MTNVNDLFDDVITDGDSPRSDSASVEDRLAKIEKDLAALIEGLAKKKKKEEYPYPEGYPKPKKDEKEKENEDEIKELKEKVDSLVEEKTELSKKVSEYEQKEKAAEINKLVNLELKKELYSKEKATDMAKEYQKLDLTAINALQSRVEAIEETEDGKASLKGKELKKAKTGEIESKIKDLKSRISTRESAGLKADDLKKELKELTEGDD